MSNANYQVAQTPWSSQLSLYFIVKEQLSKQKAKPNYTTVPGLLVLKWRDLL